jgi:hypothetical protein
VDGPVEVDVPADGLAVERDRAVDVGDGERDELDAEVHGGHLSWLAENSTLGGDQVRICPHSRARRDRVVSASIGWDRPRG